MSQPTDRVRTNPLLMLVVVLAFLVIIPVLVIAITTQDAFWFVKGFDLLPYRVIVYANGESTEYMQGVEGYEQLAAAVRDTLDRGVQRGSAIGLSPESLADAYGKYTSVEAFFEGPVKLHAAVNTHDPNQMLFLITGRHTENPIAFMGVDGMYYSNGPILISNEPLRAALQALNYDLSPAE
ncbi:MAG TPA: hypothetical protein VIO36_05010 [Anaerolineaceae bacterium]